MLLGSFSFHGIFPVQLIKIIFLVSLYLNLLGVWIILFCPVVSGLIMYTFLMPYFVMEILSAFPGLPGLFVACAFSGTLSTVAASINALATVMYEDFVSQCFRDLSNRAANWINKALCKYIQCVQPFQDIKRGYIFPMQQFPMNHLVVRVFRRQFKHYMIQKYNMHILIKTLSPNRCNRFE
uniref:Solute carrier family 5 member 12 n=1 Tax=Cyprinus carpio TaxID=7962 RepID=A0A8C2H2J5_CYPCA